MHKVVLRIPHSLVGHILTTWINIKDVNHLDTAFCSSEWRPAFLNLLASGQVVYPNIPEPVHLLASIPFLITWLNKKKILMYTLELTPQSLDASFESYVQLIAKNVRHMSLHNFKPELKPMIALFMGNEFSNLRSLQCSFSDLHEDLKIHLRCMHPTLNETRYKRCTNFGVHLFTGISLPKVTIMSVMSCRVDKPFVSAMAECCKNIQFLHLNECGNITDSDITSIARNCTSLRLISVAKQAILTDAAIIELSERCARLCVVDVVHCTALTDRSVIALATNCRLLESLYIRGNDHYTAVSMQALCEHATSTLEVLDVVDCVGIPGVAIEHVLTTCANLMILYVGCAGGPAVYSCKDMCGILSKCGKLVEKISLEVRLVTTEMLETLGTHCSGLKKLGLQCCTGGLTDTGLYALATQCTELQLLVLPEDCDIVNSFSSMLWKYIRPNLTITTDDDRIVCKIETQLDYFA